MRLADKLLSRLKYYRNNEDGAFSLMWGVSLLVMLGAVGLGVDYAILTSANAKAQSLTDTTALAAAINIRDRNGEIPKNKSEGLIGDYTAAELGYKIDQWVVGGSDGIAINVSYDEIKREAYVSVSGKTQPLFMQTFGFNELDFNMDATVKFEEKEPLAPASIALIFDNSGSMNFADNPFDENGNKPAGTAPRIVGLKNSANAFMDYLDNEIGPQDGSNGPRVLRTGMMAFSTGVINSRTVDMKWGSIPEKDINDMVPSGGTNSAPPLVDADTWLNVNEPPIHAVENPGEVPLKYVVLMTDGRNTVGTEQWVAREGTENWRAWVVVDTHLEFIDEFEIVNAFREGGDCKITNGHPVQYYEYRRSNGSQFKGFTSQRVECKKQVEVPDFDWKYLEQEDRPTEPGAWEEGEFDIESNIITRQQCDTLENEKVEIFTIAYALAPGEYSRVQRSNGTWRTEPWNITRTTSEDANIARGLLQYCATKPANFITADNAEALNDAFDRIGNTIVKEVIRISG